MQLSASAVAGITEIKYSEFTEDIRSEILFGKVTMSEGRFNDFRARKWKYFLASIPPGTLICICVLLLNLK